jgi:hypothetical protein
MPDEGKPATPTSELPSSPLAQDDLEHYKAAAIALVQRCVRNTQLEDLHAGITPASQSGSYDDVKVVSPYGEIPWNELSRISNLEVKELMIEIVNKVFTFLVYRDYLSDPPSSAKWDEPVFDAALLALAMRRKQSANS